MRFLLLLVVFCGLAGPGRARDYYFNASDGTRLHYSEVGPKGAPVIVFVPGWTMPGWIFAPQARYFSKQYQVVTFDPRGQGRSQVSDGGYDPVRRGEDIGELLDRLPGRVVVAGWSLGVLDTLAYIHQDGDAKLAGLVLIDNSVGENPPPVWGPYHPGPVLSRDAKMYQFVCGMFETRQSPAYLDRLTQTCLRLPEADAQALLRYPVPREQWKADLLSSDVPVLYVVRPHLEAQAENLQRDRPHTHIAVFPKAGHALFVDEAPRFNALMGHFLKNSVW
ncbi:AB hydrolase superfamily protein YdjP [Acidocella aquatica]|uniref:AB hydrolase superfamily protein YdjP n=1 Tax=Acidocella aquatica TaxID=1922313 RepID=A0ABQ6A5C7_9PROT|nr:alpha/beta hydrolase [Acidocella aquatica]GLR67659.1 AB hydrolase superfamily protein YdjP [Acidocella aquatica]